MNPFFSTLHVFSQFKQIKGFFFNLKLLSSRIRSAFYMYEQQALVFFAVL